MSLSVQLLGTPKIVQASGESYPFRSRKSWALLAYLVLADRPLVGGHQTCGRQVHPAVRGREVVGEDDGLARVVLGQAWIGDAAFALQALPADAGDRKSARQLSLLD